MGSNNMKKVFSLSCLWLLVPGVTASQEKTEDGVSLSPLLMNVADRSGADVVAPRIAALIANVPQEQVIIDDFDRILLETTGCFGSVELSKVLAPYIVTQPADDLPEIAQHMALLHEMWTVFDELTAAINGIQNAEDAEKAAELLSHFKPFMISWSHAVSAVAAPESELAKRQLRMKYLVETRPRIGHLLNAWGDLALRNAEYYGSMRLVEGLQDVCDVLENMDMAADPDVMPALAATARKLIPLLHQWIGVISLVHDKDSADAAAIHIVRLHEQMAAVMEQAALSRVYEKDLFNVSPQFELHAHVCDRIMHYLLDEVKPPCFGSEKLKSALQHED